uniref:fimbrillin family protein n=2 Tax=uncultured Bacteroides sp. TaxID=162156 RepID=UPI0025F1EFC1|nr:fimbrillin family protein [uncultured Bacteroides sp.]
MKKKDFISTGKSPGVLLGAAFCIVMFLAGGCSSDSEKDVPQGDGRVPLVVSSGIDVQTRAHDKTWETGDAIGIYMLSGAGMEAANKLYTTGEESTSGIFAAAEGNTIYFPIDGTTRDFVAYYPYRDLGEENTTYTVDVSEQKSQKGIDLMGAAKETGKHKNDPKVKFVFTHKLVKLALTIQADGSSLTADKLEGMMVKLSNQRTQATYDVVTGGSVTVDTQTAPATLVLKTNPKGTSAEGIVLPCDNTQGMNLEFHLRGGATYTWAVNKAEKSKQFNAGSKYVYTITIGNTGLDVTSTIEDWTPGNGSGESGSAQ